jgi:cellulose synthase (UDP-forming)
MQTLKPISESRNKFAVSLPSVSGLRVQTATLVLLAIVGLLGGIALSWLLGNTHVIEIFTQLHLIEENPPVWLRTPEWGNKYYLLAPTLIMFVLAQVIIKLSPQPQTWSRGIVVSIMLVLMVRYILWRSLSTLNLINPVDGIFSILLLLMELVAMAGGLIQLCLMFTIKNRHEEADKYGKAVTEGTYSPSVDILIPSYNEPDFILKRTIVGAQALDYPYKQIYLLDDTKRPEIKQLAQELGCNYLTRPNNSHAKAGNLNHALKRTDGELVVVFDADFVPTKNFLTRTVGFFQNPKIGLVQTPQSFYNSDPIARNLGLEGILTSEEEVFYRQTQPIKDGAGSVVCAGTSFIARRSALQEIGFFVTESLSEDYFTGIRIASKGYELVYLDEKLSAGLAAESISTHIEQRLRWARGTLQAFFIDSNPLTISGLNLWQRLGHLEGLLHWFTGIPRLFFLFVPLIYIFFGVEAIKVDISELIYVFLPFYVMQLSVFSWLNLRSRSILLSDVYSLVQSFPVSLTVIKVMLSPFSRGFKVTPKGLSRERFYFNWRLAFPLILILTASLFSFSMSLLNAPVKQSLNLGLIWSAYNILTISAALLTMVDIPKPSYYEWFSLNKKVQIRSGNESYWTITEKIAEEGVEIAWQSDITLPKNITIEFVEDGLSIEGYITHTFVRDKNTTLRVKFRDFNLAQQKSLIEMIYCSPGQWKRRNSPGEFKSLLILFKVLLRPLHLFRPKPLPPSYN